ncbi:MAG: YeaH/YhbH family protein [Burkholderiaceae bacterium]
MSVVIDRRLNDRNKSASNRERFMRRYKGHIKRAVSDMVADRSIRDMQRGGSVKIPTKDINEPKLRHGEGGDRETVLPGNRQFNPGDKLRRPPGGGEGQGQGEGGEGGGGEDDFVFTLTRDEFMSIFFDDLELPNLVRTYVGNVVETKPQRAGYTRQGAPVNMSVVQTMRSAMGRRLALAGPSKRRLSELEQHILSNELSVDQHQEAVEEIETLKRKIKNVPFLDEIDLRFRHRIMVPKPVSQAVMFCLMDVSASMDEHKKDLAKRFYTLLYLFLSRKYEKVEVIFIRHTDDAEEVNENDFFNDRKTGGTVVYSALKLMHEIIEERFPSSEWNIYGAQASDGDAFGADPEKSRIFLEESILPLTRHFAYIEVTEQRHLRTSTLGAAYSRVQCAHFAMVEVEEHRHIYPVFRELFSRRQAGIAA